MKRLLPGFVVLLSLSAVLSHNNTSFALLCALDAAPDAKPQPVTKRAAPGPEVDESAGRTSAPAPVPGEDYEPRVVQGLLAAPQGAHKLPKKWRVQKDI
eukprot:jgi/Tetstr1/427318/TSEL_017487.t1